MMKEGEVPGLSLAVVEHGKLVYSKAYGYANLAKATPLTTEHTFQIGSITKSFAAVAVMLLAEDGKIKLDDPISAYLGPVPAAWQPITVRHFLNHTSGMPEDFNRADLEAFWARPGDAEFLELAKKYSLLSKPGAAYSYSNTGFNLLGIIIAKASGESYGSFLQERIFGPLKMNATRVMHPQDSLVGMATGYIKNSGRIEVDNNPASSRSYLAGAASGIESNPQDLAKFDAALHAGVLPSLASQAEMWTHSAQVQAASSPADTGVYYGLGWYISTVDGYRKIYHSGGMPSYISDFIRYPREGISVIVLTNQGYSGREPQLISRKVAQLFRAGLPYCCDPK
jgi:D-alanyl-D-alanine carboxypeptidase